jgi:hypothetical protein
MRRAVPSSRLLPALFVAIGLFSLGSFALAPLAPRGLTDDERDYLAAASNLDRFGVFSAREPAPTAPRPDAYREPGYPVLLAVSWRVERIEPPADPAQLERFARLPVNLRAARRLHLALWLASAVGAGALAVLFSSTSAWTLAFALVAASPALARSMTLFASENLAAPLLVLATLALVRAADGGGGGGGSAGGLCGGAGRLWFAPRRRSRSCPPRSCSLSCRGATRSASG